MNKLILGLLGVLAIVCVVFGDEDFYSDKYDSIDLDSILGSKRLIRNYMHCFAKKGPCTPEGAYLAEILPEAMKTECAKCSQKQKDATIKTIKRLAADYPEEWAEIEERLDPTGELYAKFKARFP